MSYFHPNQLPLSAEVPHLSEILEAIDRFSNFAPASKNVAIQLFCKQAGISQAKFAHIGRVWVMRGEEL